MKIKVLYKQVGKPAEVREIEDDHHVIRELIGGPFSGYFVKSFVPDPHLYNVAIFCHDEGKLIGLPANCYIGSELLVGDIVLYAANEHGEGMDITGFQATLLSHYLKDGSLMRIFIF
ncbi:MAG: DUF3846 domain-containing protein [Clostridia bacterium]|nr:DUF3846 domain-containing protein [Clostridia bacterium]